MGFKMLGYGAIIIKAHRKPSKKSYIYIYIYIYIYMTNLP